MIAFPTSRSHYDHTLACVKAQSARSFNRLDHKENLFREDLGTVVIMSGVYPELQFQVHQHGFLQAGLDNVHYPVILSTAEVYLLRSFKTVVHFYASKSHSHVKRLKDLLL